MEADRDGVLRRIRERLGAIQRLRAEAAELRAELLRLDEELRGAHAELTRVRAELASRPGARRAAELSRYASELLRAARDAEDALREADLDARLEIHEIEVGLAVDDALRLRELAEDLIRQAQRGPDEPL